MIISVCRLDYTISTQWDGRPTDHAPITVTLEPGDGHVTMKVKAAFFDDPPNPGGTKGEPYSQLWDHEGELGDIW